MSVSRRMNQLLPGLLLGVCGMVLAADNELPEAALLEYLGSWEGSDEEWLIFVKDSEQLTADSEKRIDPAPQGEESTENDDEG